MRTFRRPSKRPSRPIRRARSTKRVAFKKAGRPTRRFPASKGIKKGPAHIRVVTNGINNGYSKWTVAKNSFMNRMSKLYFVGAKNIFQKMTPFPIGWSSGLQAYQGISLFSIADITACLSAISEAPSDTIGETVNTARSYFEKCDAELVCTNSSNVQAIQDIYVYRCKSSCNVTPIQIWSAAMKDESGQTGTDYTTFYGVKPWMCPALEQYWTLKAVYHTTMQPGQSHIQRFNHHFCLPMQNALLDTQYESDAYLSGKSYYIMIITRGMAETASTASFVTTTTGKVDYVYSQTYSYKYISDNTTNFNYSAASAFGTAGSIYNQGSGGTIAAAGI